MWFEIVSRLKTNIKKSVLILVRRSLMWRNQILCQVVGWVSSSSSTWVFCWNLLKIFDDLGCGIREILQKLALWKWQYPSNGGRLILISTLSIANIFYVLVCHLKKCELETLEDPKILPLWNGALEKKNFILQDG